MSKLTLFILGFLVSTPSAADFATLEQKLTEGAKHTEEKYSIYQYQGRLHYVVSREHLCCDRGAILHNEKGEVVCYLAGFTGMWEDRCNTFASEAKLLKEITPKD